MPRTISSLFLALVVILTPMLEAAPAAAAGCKQSKLVGRYGLATGNVIGQSDNLAL